MNNRSIYPSYDEFSKDDEYAYCQEDYELFQDALDDVEKKTTKSINSLLQKHGYGHLKVDYFDIGDTEMDEVGFDIHASIFFDGKGISTSNLQYIDFTLTGDVTTEYEEHDYLDHSQIRWNTISPPYVSFSIMMICPDISKITEFSVDGGRDDKFSLNNFLKAIEEHIIKKSKTKRGSNMRRQSNSFQEGDIVWSQTGWSMKIANFYSIASIDGRKVFLKKLDKKQVSGNRQSWEVMPILGSEGSRLYQGVLKGNYIQLKKEELMGWSGGPVAEWEVQHIHDQHRFASNRRMKAADQFIEEGNEETICDPMAPMECTGVLRFKNGKPIPAYIMLRGFLVGVAVAQNNPDVIEKYGEDVLDKLERAIRGWLRKASGNAEYTLSAGQKRWLNQTLGGKSGILSPILRKYVVTECSKSGGCDLPDPDRFRFARKRAAVTYLTLVPAYRKDYKSKKEVEAAWNNDEDFIVQDMMSPWDGSYINKSDAKAQGIKSVTIRFKQLRNVTVIKVATQDKTASRYSLPAKKGIEIVFGIDRAMGWFFQLWLDEDEPALDESFLSNGKLIELLEKYGKPSRDLDKAIQAVASDLEPADFGVRGIRASHSISRKKKSNGCGCRKEKVAFGLPQSIEEIEIGSVWVSSNHYYGIRHTFYEVVGKTAKRVKLRKLRKGYLGNPNAYSYAVTAKAGDYESGSKPILVKVVDGYRGVALKAGGKYGISANLWNGHPMEEMTD